MPIRTRHCVALLTLLACAAAPLRAQPLQAQPVASVQALAEGEKAPLLDTLRDLVNIESGSKDAEGLARLAELIRGRRGGRGGPGGGRESARV